jgi:hypothetical protein
MLIGCTCGNVRTRSSQQVTICTNKCCEQTVLPAESSTAMTRTCCNELSHSLEVTAEARVVQWRVSVLILQIHNRSFFQQESNNVCIASHAGAVQRCEAILQCASRHKSDERKTHCFLKLWQQIFRQCNARFDDDSNVLSLSTSFSGV